MNDIPIVTSLASPPEAFKELFRYQDGDVHTLFSYKDKIVVLLSGEPDDGFYLQIELPKQAMSWLADVIDVQLGKAPNDGGLPVGTALVAQEFDGEIIQVCRLANTRGGGEPGFEVMNRSRHCNVDEDDMQGFEFTDEVMRAVGLVEKFRALAGC
ncbi:hypothetical protein PVT67_00410 [Gallaecimonas kandeliae]|uniref:hypothetical protein n=1 Tax=Gallaecimonas kandeliae TaxID=3029055 RepID=UPI00264920B8|nr:hypothetical protein [Gallaecimonas kandeliae]WKE65753.1 hypothetical protein PVT67_00410 [Gallaecimonas kandeliae]